MNERILHIVFQKSESDIICWMRSLKPGTVNSTVNEILSAESKGKLAVIPYRFSSANDEEKANCRFIIRAGPALDFVAKIPRGKIKQTLVRVIRKHIRKSSELPPPPVLIRGDYVVKLLGLFEKKVAEKEATYAGIPDKYSFLTESYCKAYETVLCEILYSFDMQSNRQALEYLCRINITDIINAAYSRQNGTDGLQDGEEQTKSNNKENKNHE